MELIASQCKSVIRSVKHTGTPYDYDANIYRGCMHGCVYCYAIYSHAYLDDESFFDHIYYKENFCEILEKEISSPKWKKEIINFGSVSDSYQPAEKELKIMRDVLRLMIKYQNPINISTKSALILRDIDLISELSKVTDVQIECSITCADERVRKILEPYSSPSIERMKVLQILKQKTQAHIHVLMMPIVPYMNDSYENMEAIYKLACQIGVETICPGTMYLRGKTRSYFLNYIKEYNADLYQKLYRLYSDKKVKQNYKTELYRNINKLRKQYHL